MALMPAKDDRCDICERPEHSWRIRETDIGFVCCTCYEVQRMIELAVEEAVKEEKP